jgi:hypothetical protein
VVLHPSLLGRAQSVCVFRVLGHEPLGPLTASGFGLFLRLWGWNHINRGVDKGHDFTHGRIHIGYQLLVGDVQWHNSFGRKIVVPFCVFFGYAIEGSDDCRGVVYRLAHNLHIAVPRFALCSAHE